MQQRSSTALTVGKDLAKNTAHFLCYLLSIVDRGVVFKLVRSMTTAVQACGFRALGTQF
jgi:hypothetical protein